MTKIVFAILIALGWGANLRAQELSAEAGFGGNLDVSPSLFWNLSCNYAFNDYLDAAGGIHVVRGRLKYSGNGYEVDDRVYKLNGMLSLNAYTPSYRNFGLFGGASFSFELLPVDFTTVRHIETDREYWKARFSRFNPACWLNAGVSYMIDDVGYWSVGVVYSPRYDLYAGYRNLHVNGTYVGLASSSLHYWGLFLRFSTRDL
ncbi:MAG: hypothetical protein LBD35_03295 [Prevotellaceae bacterium]|jgi:hypothetical protein|nr:hypothetical protein [Prevotellaceae bacterium]